MIMRTRRLLNTKQNTQTRNVNQAKVTFLDSDMDDTDPNREDDNESTEDQDFS